MADVNEPWSMHKSVVYMPLLSIQVMLLIVERRHSFMANIEAEDEAFRSWVFMLSLIGCSASILQAKNPSVRIGEPRYRVA